MKPFNWVIWQNTRWFSFYEHSYFKEEEKFFSDEELKSLGITFVQMK